MAEANSVQTEADAFRDILQWAADRPIWQQDALRRLVTQGELTDSDVDELTALCKNPGLDHEPLAAAHISAQHSGAPTVALKNLHGVQNVNALAENQSLTFISTGVTIIYGDNGAGKSGYVRILKNACRARMVKGKDDTILHNIYETPTGPQRAELEFHAGAQVQKAEWKTDTASDPLLSEISVFDSRTANVHVEQTNDLAYTPYPMKVLERLVGACRAVKDKLDGEVSAIKAQTPQSISNPVCSAETKVGQLIGGLGNKIKPETVTALATLSEQELTRLAELNSDFAQDPAATARRLRAQKNRLESLRTKLQALADAVSTECAQKLEERASDLRTKSEAARLASQDLSRDEPLDGVGSESWRKLWEAARAYSVQEAYPEQDFPVSGDDARCVLCQQEVGQDAAARLRRFEAFVQDRTQKDEEVARQALDDARHAILEAAVPMTDLMGETRFIADELGNAELATATRRHGVRLKWRLRAVIKSNAEAGHALPQLADTPLQGAIDALESRATALLADEQSDERKALRSELAELTDRQWLSGIKEDVLAEIERRKCLSALDTVLKDTRPNAITQKNTALSEALITDRLRGRFAREINHLNLADLEVELTQARSQHGVSRFRVSLIESKSNNAGDILSEGEYRCVALAGFMAELATNNSGSGIIFDDPVSSLDHLHREAIAKRLAEEGRKRQVIVFTHDLPFLFMLRNACTQVDDPSLKTDVALRHIQKRQNTPGHCRNEAPDKAQDATTRLRAMRSHLTNCRVQYDNDPDSTDWLITARGLIDSLRQAWEAAVEDAISPVLRTFSSKVDTKGFSKLSAITEGDASTMRQHYGQCSVLLHKASDAINPSAPTPETIEKELDALDAWLRAICERQNNIKAA
ncbi:MAG: AAA family ATPase [Rhizobiaceae bacterium]|nr:AAA family ATPase [Rhizobiaceae bacterium]